MLTRASVSGLPPSGLGRLSLIPGQACFFPVHSGILAHMKLQKAQEWIKDPRHRLYVLAAAVLAAGIVLVYLAAARMVTVVVNGETRDVRTHARKVSSIIRSAGLNIQPGDSIHPEPDSRISEGQAVFIDQARPVHLVYDGDTQTVLTPELLAGNILSQVDIELFPGDMVWVDGVPYSGLNAAEQVVQGRLEVQPAHSLTVDTGGSREQVWVGGGTLAEGLWRAGIKLVQADKVSEDLSAPLPEPSEIEINRSFPVSFTVRGREYSTRVLEGTVAEALETAGIVLVGLDRTDQPEDSTVTSGEPIVVTRVEEEVVLDQEPLPFEVVYQADPESMIDTQSLLDAGEYGVQAERVRVRYEDGEETARLLEGSWTVREPQPRVVGYGTKIEIRTLDTPDGPIEYWRAIDMYATSYSPSRAGVPDDYPYFGITACGIKAEKGVVAVDRNYIPFYTPLYIPGYGTAIACDTGSAIKGRRIDLGYDDDNWETWHWDVTVYFLTPVPDPANIAWIIP